MNVCSDSALLEDYYCICACSHTCVLSRVQEPEEARMCWIPGSWSYRWQWAAPCGCWELNWGPLEEQWTFLGATSAAPWCPSVKHMTLRTTCNHSMRLYLGHFFCSFDFWRLSSPGKVKSVLECFKKNKEDIKNNFCTDSMYPCMQVAITKDKKDTFIVFFFGGGAGASESSCYKSCPW